MKNIKKNKKQKKPPDAIQIPWHPAFIEALKLEFDDYKEILEFHPEHQLTTDPLRIDCVVIKKTKDVEIKKNIGKIFRTWNLIEYKSPEDYAAVKDFYKVYGYACIYTFLNDIPINELTITIIESHYPRELIRHFIKIRRFTVAETSAGVYNVDGDILPIQIIDNRKLSAEGNIWLKNLSNKLSISDIEQIRIKIVQQGKAANIDAYKYAVMYAFTNNITKKEKYMIPNEFILNNKEAFHREFGSFLEKFGFLPESKLSSVIADKDAKIANKDAQIVRMQAELEQLKKNKSAE